MAGADYYSCDKCRRKTFYDAGLDYQYNKDSGYTLPNVGDMKVICIDCAKVHEVHIVTKRIKIGPTEGHQHKVKGHGTG